MGWAEAITAASAAVTAGSVVWGISAWRREYVGKRKIELAETILALFYEAEEAVRDIRSPGSFEHEGKTRKRADHESEEQSRMLDRLHIPIERLETKTKLFAELRALRYRAMATFGSSAGEPFEELRGAVGRIFVSACELRRLHESGQAINTEVEELREKYESSIWRTQDDQDKIEKQVHRAVEKIEAITKEAMKPRLGFMGKLWRRFK